MLEEQVRSILLLEGNVVNLINDDGPVAAKPDQFLRQPVVMMGVLEPGTQSNDGRERGR